MFYLALLLMDDLMMFDLTQIALQTIQLQEDGPLTNYPIEQIYLYDLQSIALPLH